MASRIIKDSMIYGMGTIVGRSFGFVMIPVYTRFLEVSEYGALAVLNIILQGVSFICLLGVGTASMRFYFDPDADDMHRRAVYGNALTILLVFPPMVILAITPLARWFSENYLQSIQFQYVFIILLTGLFMPLSALMRGYLRVRKKPVAFVSVQVGFFLVQTLAIIVAVVILKQGLLGQVYSQLFAQCMFAVIAVLVLVRYTRPAFSAPLARRLLRFGIPLIPFFLLTWIDKGVGRFMLEHYVGLAELGIFALAVQFSGLLSLAATALDNAFMPHFLERASKDNAERALGRLTNRYIVVFGLIALAIVAVGPVVILLVASEAYYPAIDYLAPLVLAGWLQVCGQPIIWSLTHTMRPTTLSTIRALSVAILVAFAIWLVGGRGMGVLGLAIAMIAANIFTLVVGYTMAQLSFPMKLPRGKLAISSLTMLMGGSLIYMLPDDTLAIAPFAARVAILLVTSLVALRLIGIANPPKFLLDSIRTK